MVKSDEVWPSCVLVERWKGEKRNLLLCVILRIEWNGSNYNIRGVVKTVVANVNWIKSDCRHGCDI